MRFVMTRNGVDKHRSPRRSSDASRFGHRAPYAKLAHEETFNDFRVLLASVAEPSFAANLAAVPDRAQLGGSEDE